MSTRPNLLQDSVDVRYFSPLGFSCVYIVCMVTFVLNHLFESTAKPKADSFKKLRQIETVEAEQPLGTTSQGVIKTFGVPKKMVIEVCVILRLPVQRLTAPQFRILRKPYTVIRPISLALVEWLNNVASTEHFPELIGHPPNIATKSNMVNIAKDPNAHLLSGLSPSRGSSLPRNICRKPTIPRYH